MIEWLRFYSSNVNVNVVMFLFHVAPNPWNILESPGFWVWQMLLLAIHITSFLYILSKYTRIVCLQHPPLPIHQKNFFLCCCWFIVLLLFQVIYTGRFQLSIAQLLCIFEMIALLSNETTLHSHFCFDSSSENWCQFVCLICRFFCWVRIVYLSLDPLGSRKIIPYRGIQIMATLSLLFHIAGDLLILFYWQEILTRHSLQVSPFLSKLIAPFIILVVVLFLLDLAGIASFFFFFFFLLSLFISSILFCLYSFFTQSV